MGWYYAKDGAQCGPVTETDLRGMLERGEISESTLVWSEGMDEWKAYSVVLGRPADARSAGMPAVSPPPSSMHTDSVETYMTRSIVTTVLGALCCWISLVFGILGIIAASQAGDACKRGDYGTAVAKSQSAKQMSTIGLLLVIIPALLYFVFFFLGIIAEIAGV